MGEVTSIAWCDHTFNGWIGCEKVSPGCANCYAANETYVRVARSQGRELWGGDADRHVTSEANWRKPLAWNRAAREAGERHRVFAASLSDVFEDRPDLAGPRARLFGLVAATKSLDWLVLTKRPGVAAHYFRNRERMWDAAEVFRDLVYGPDSGVELGDGLADWPPRNVWLGTSVENRKHGLPRVDELRKVPAAVRFLSVEPLLEDLGRVDLTGIHWVIVGGESGPDARPCYLAWVASVVDQCKAAGVPVFVKQLGANAMDAWQHRPGDIERGRLVLNDRKGGDPAEWPADLRVREFPVP